MKEVLKAHPFAYVGNVGLGFIAEKMGTNIIDAMKNFTSFLMDNDEG